MRTIMTNPVRTVTPGQSARECMQLMNDHRFRHLPVVDEAVAIWREGLRSGSDTDSLLETLRRLKAPLP